MYKDQCRMLDQQCPDLEPCSMLQHPAKYKGRMDCFTKLLLCAGNHSGNRLASLVRRCSLDITVTPFEADVSHKLGHEVS